MKHAIIKTFIKIVTMMTLMAATVSVATPTHWYPLVPGLEYTRLSHFAGFYTGYIHAFRINLNHYQLQLALAQDHRNSIANVNELAVERNAIIGINGGFFSEELKPLGLRINNSKIRNPLKSTPWWGVFFIRDNKAHIIAQQDYRQDKQITFAVQSGPRLVINDHIPTLKGRVDNRTAIGITRPGEVILLVTENLSLTTTQLAKVMRGSQIEGGLECIDAINLDGGSSTQLYAKINHFVLKIPGWSAVTDAILVLPYDQVKKR
jgi:uncharacterized protein YigE (DUF2233 family)